ncbi:MAG: methylamine utilization protein, partial [Steroidobacteraceae bacterium]
ALLCASPALVAPARAASLRVLIERPDGAPLQDALVYATPAIPVRPSGPLRAVIDQIHRQFVPRVSIVETGTLVDFPNSDNIRHSVYSFSPAKTFDLKLYAGRSAQPVLFDKPGLVVLGCEIHDSMVGWVLVVDTPYFARTDRNGRATLANLAPGGYTLRAWHEPMRAVSAGEVLHVGSAAPPSSIVVHLDPGPPAAPPASMHMAHAPGLPH